MGWVEGAGSWSMVILLQITFSIAQSVLKPCCIQEEEKAFPSLLPAVLDL